MSRLDQLQGGTGMFRKGPQASAEAAREAETSKEETKETKPAKPNAYAGNCTSCGGRVEAGEGLLGPRVDGRWTVTHDGQCPLPLHLMKPDKGQGDIGDTDRAPQPDGPRFTTNEVHPGIYTLETEHGHRTFRVWLQPREEDFAPGETIIEYLVGQDNENDYRRFGFIKGGRLIVWKRFRTGHDGLIADAMTFLTDPDATVLVAKHCLRCNALLSHPDSVKAGLGPDCIKKGW